MRIHGTLLFLLVLTLGNAPARAQTPLHVFDGSGGNETGYAIDVDGDADGDGRDDVIVSSYANRVRVYSGVNGGLLYDFQGRAAAWAGDTNADGYDDIVLRKMPGTPPKVQIYSGLDGSLLQEFTGTTGSSYGWSVDGAGDVNDDGHADVIIGAPNANQAAPAAIPNGRFEVRSGLNGSLLLGVDGGSQQMLGGSVSGAGDVNADGFDDVIVGSGDGLTISLPGRAVVYSGFSGAVLRQVVDTSPVLNLNYVVKGTGDLDLDGRDDFLVGVPQFNASAGRVQAFSGQTGAVLFTLNGAASSVGLGFSLSGAGDIDGDAVPDIVLGSYYSLAGRAQIVSGAGGSLLREITGTEAGWSVAGGGDVDGDGIPDVATGNPFAVTTGRARVYAGATFRDDLYLGTQDGVSLVLALDGLPDSYSVLLAGQGRSASLHAGVPAGLGAAPLFVFGQFFATAAGMPALPGFPSIHLDPAQLPALVTLFDSTATIFGPTTIPASGIDVFLGVVPAGLNGLSLSLQAFSIGGAASANGTFSASDAKELRLL